MIPTQRRRGIHIPVLPRVVDTLTAARAYADAGMYIGPLQNGSKNPGSVLGRDWPEKTTCEMDYLTGHLHGRADLGLFLHCGRSGLIAIDVDRPERIPTGWWEHLDAAPFQSTRSNVDRQGHYLFGMPDGRTIGNANIPGGGGEVRGNNGVIVLAPTRHEKAAQGGLYRIVRGGLVPVLPTVIADLLPDAGSPATKAADLDVDAFLDCHDDDGRPTALDPILRSYQEHIALGHSRHATAVSHACWIAREAAAGYFSAREAFDQLAAAFDASFSAEELRAGRGTTVGEWDDLMAWAIGQVDEDEVEAKRCELTRTEVPARYRPLTKQLAVVGGVITPDRRQVDSQPEAQAETEVGNDLDDVRATWAPVDLSSHLSGDYVCPTPTLMPRADGLCLLYPGLVHSIHGESESGKSWIAQSEAARLIKMGLRVLYVDFESDPGSVAGRLRELGCSSDQIIECFHYVQPETAPQALAERAAWGGLLGTGYDLVVIDGVTDSLGLWGYNSNENDEVATWLRDFPRRFAAATGAAVVLIDHVVKNTSARGRFAVGAQAKMAGLSGAAYTVTVQQPLGRGLRGELLISVGKDRPGGVRGFAGSMNPRDRTQPVAVFVLDSTGDQLTARLELADDTPRLARPEALLHDVAQWVAQNPGASAAAIESGVTGKAQRVRDALKVLVNEGYLRYDINGRGKRYYCINPYPAAAA
jgi:hypothetical protein